MKEAEAMINTSSMFFLKLAGMFKDDITIYHFWDIASIGMDPDPVVLCYRTRVFLCAGY